MTREVLPKRVREFIRGHPDTSPTAVLGRFDELDTDDLDAIADALGSAAPEFDTDDEASERHGSTGSSGVDPGSAASNPTSDSERAAPEFGEWTHADWSNPEPDTFTPERLAREQWMGRAGENGKLPFAEWADPDHPEAAPDEDARWKWGIEDNYRDGETVAIAEESHRLDGRVFIQREDDPYAFVDGDDVRCPETGEVHPSFVAILEHLGLTYADVSTSGAGVHANYRGELPDGVKQATFAIDDEPWGANEDLPEVEIYDGKHVCVVTGDHVPGTPVEITEWDDDALRAILDANGQLPTERPDGASEAFREFDAEAHDPDATERDEVATDVRDIFAALDRLDARRVADWTIVHQWNDDASTSEGKRAFVPIWGKNANGTANVVDDEIWQDTGGGGYGGAHVMAAIACDDTDVDETATPRDVTGADWWRAVEYLRDEGFAIPEYDGSDAEGDEWATERDVTLDPEVAWRAAGVVTPDDLDGELSLATTDDGSGWRCPRCGETVNDVARAAAIDRDVARCCAEDLGQDGYHRGYEYARDGFDAPLPRFVGRETATERWGVVTGALKDLDYWHLDEDQLDSEVTATGDDVTGDAIQAINPAWRFSESEESVKVFESGTVYEPHPDHDGTVDALRFAALDAGVISWEEFTDEENHLTGATFRAAYDAARDLGAPLPRWEGTDAFHTAVLPPAEELVEDADVGDDDRLTAAYDAVGDCYHEAATTPDTSLLTVLPGLGKTGQVFRQATEHPTLYTAGRKELMADAVERANEHGASAYVLPVFGEQAPPEDVSDAAEAAVREEGQHLLRDRWSLVEHVDQRLPDGVEVRKPEEYDDGEEEDVALDRGSCPTANGEHGVDWWLAVHAARARGYRPQQIHKNGAALFGADLPCTCGEDDEDETCEYTAAWERATDPDDPIDVLVGHYTYAHVEGARTYATRENGRVRNEPRVVAVDEFPGDAYRERFGDEFPDLAAWLAGALRPELEDRQDLLTNASALWDDDVVRAYLAPDAIADEHERVMEALAAARAGLEAAETAAWLLESRGRAVKDLGVTDALKRVRDAHPAFDAGEVVTARGAISTAVEADDNRGADPTVLRALDDVAGALRVAALDEGTVTDEIDAAIDAADHVAGPLRSLVEEAVAAYRRREDSADDQLAAAQAALGGGREGCEALAMHADSGYAHPLAHALLFALLAAAGDAGETVETASLSFSDEDGTRLETVEFGENTVLVDRNHHGAVVNQPPAFTVDGDDNPVVGLDATGRPALWEIAVGRDVTVRDIHETDAGRREFLRDVFGLQVVQTSPHANSYEGDPSGKNFDDDVELVREIREEYADAIGQDPAVITTKVVEDTLRDRLERHTTDLAHYGDVKGSNALKHNRLAALLGCQHYGDQVVEEWAALAGEEVTRTGHGMELDYDSDIANTALRHMREDGVMQAALRFGRDAGGAVVFTHTAAVRDDLPVVGEGEVVRTYSETAQDVAEAAADFRHRTEFTSADVRDRVDDASPRTIRRVLAELADAGYLDKTQTRNGVADRYDVVDEAPAAEIDLPTVESRASDPGQEPLEVVYTWSVRVVPGAPRGRGHRTGRIATLPAPEDESHATLAGPLPG